MKNPNEYEILLSDKKCLLLDISEIELMLDRAKQDLAIIQAQIIHHLKSNF